jgi:23S rRNA (cytosine1962-C5)-methyltransferase
MQEIADKSLLNLFAYTCGVGIAAAKAGARFVVNVDFSDSSLKIGKENARYNTLAVRPRFIKSDAFAAMRQLSGLGQAEFVRGKRMPPFPKLEAQTFDCVFLTHRVMPKALLAWWISSMITPQSSSPRCCARMKVVR